MDAIELLKKDHEQVRALFRRYRGGGGMTGLVKRVTGNVTTRERRTAIRKVCKELDVHTRIEEQIFYPAVRALQDAELSRLVDESIREHGSVKDQIASLKDVNGDEDDLDGRVTSLEQSVEHHATEEENQMFPRLEELMPEKERSALGGRLATMKRSMSGGATRSTKRAASAKSGTRRSAQTAAHARTRTKTRTTTGRRTRARNTGTTTRKRGKRTKQARARRR